MIPERIADRIEAGDCWIWKGAIFTSTGYGQLSGRTVHSVVYELLVGEIPKGLELDHLCRVRACCNPDHLEPVTRSENARRGRVGRNCTYVNNQKVCKRGHIGQYREDGRCIPCHIEREAHYRAARRTKKEESNGN